jgi:hypothetical protein
MRNDTGSDPGSPRPASSTDRGETLTAAADYAWGLATFPKSVRPEGKAPPVPIPLDCPGSLLPVDGLRPGVAKVRCDSCRREVFVRPPPPVDSVLSVTAALPWEPPSHAPPRAGAGTGNAGSATPRLEGRVEGLLFCELKRAVDGP